jgi:DNA-binding transcriptional LysR family regulator
MELHEIKYFLALTKTRNFTRAAETCNVSQPALTRAIQKMEDELGGALFVRERNNTHLTPLGRLLEPHLNDVVNRTEAARETATRFLRLEGGHLSLGVMCTIGPVRFVSFLSRFRAAHADIEMTLIEATADRLCQLLSKGELDVALIARPAGFEAPLQASVLYAERFVIACSGGHPFARKDMVRVAELDGQPYLVRINCEYFELLRDTCRANGSRLQHSFRSEREDWIQIMVAAGMGICFLPEYSATVPGVVIRPVVAPAITREIALVTVAGRRWSAPLATFVEAAQRYRWPEQAEERGRRAPGTADAGQPGQPQTSGR